MAKGKIKVQADNIFPIIKKFLYSDHEIFLRELISNAVDATQKLNTFSRQGEFKGEVGDTLIEVRIDKEAKTLTISDQGIGMTEEEVKKYINQIAFSGAEDFLEKYKDKDPANIIGHFGLGFYSSFMVADVVEIKTKSFKKEPAVQWKCDGSPEFTLKEIKKEGRGTDVILHISEDSTEFLEEGRIRSLLEKYCRFMPVEIKFGTKTQSIDKGEGDDKETETFEVDDIINIPEPAWTKAPAKLKDEDYKEFYRQLYPMNFEEPLFHIHMNVDYPFNLTGILYFPKLKNKIEVQKDKIQLYSNQVFVTDSVEGIVPDFLTLLHGVIDSPDIPLNVSRSYLQADGAVKKVSGHITKKVADKLEDMFKKDRKDLEEKWEDIKVFIDYGMLSEEKFYERAEKFALFKTVDGEYFTLEEYRKKIEKAQTDKDKKVVYLYTTDPVEQHTYVKNAQDRGYKVLVMDSPLTSHLVQHLETKVEKSTFTRVDADTIDKLIKKDEEIPNKLSEKEEEKLKPIIEEAVDKERFMVSFESMNEKDSPITITQPEFMRRMKEQSQLGGGGMMGMGNMPEMYNLVVNSNHPLMGKILAEKTKKKKQALVKQATDLALLSQGQLKGEDLAAFIDRSIEMIE